MTPLSHTDLFKKKDARFLLNDLLSVAIIGLVFAALAIIMKHDGATYLHHLRDYFILRMSETGWPEAFGRVVLFIVAGSILVTVGIPRLWVSAASGRQKDKEVPLDVHHGTRPESASSSRSKRGLVKEKRFMTAVGSLLESGGINPVSRNLSFS